ASMECSSGGNTNAKDRSVENIPRKQCRENEIKYGGYDRKENL
ncbi:15690_t:CDS:1, partial [Dentiscutata erythropus]